jgi:signal transduction histidine kinase
VDEHGGEIDFTSEKDKGTKFFVRLPDNEAPAK